MTMNPRILRITGAPGAWCHLCGTPVDRDPCIGIDVPNNAVGADEWSKGHRTFVQMCQPCIEAIGKAILPPAPAPKPDLMSMLMTETVASPPPTISLSLPPPAPTVVPIAPTPAPAPAPVVPAPLVAAAPTPAQVSKPAAPVQAPTAPSPTTSPTPSVSLPQSTPKPGQKPIKAPPSMPGLKITPYTRLSDCLLPHTRDLVRTAAVNKGMARPRTLAMVASRINYADLFLLAGRREIAVVEKVLHSAGLALAKSPVSDSTLHDIKYHSKVRPLSSLLNLSPSLLNAVQSVAKERGIRLTEKSTLYDIDRMPKDDILRQKWINAASVEYLSRRMSVFGVGLS